MASSEPPRDTKPRDSSLTEYNSRDVLDSILSSKGPMPPAKLGIRTLAFLLDFILLTAVASLIIWKIIMPQAHPETSGEFLAWFEQFVQAAQETPAGEDIDVPPVSNSLAEGIAYARDMLMLIFWLYFALGEALFKGSTLGKRACRLRSISTITLAPPTLIAGILRGGLKTIAIFYPPALIATMLAVFFNKRRQLGHDMLAKTAVLDEKYVNHPKL